MAFDNSPTQNRIIAAVAATTGITLIALKFVFDSYFVQVMEEETHDRLLPNTEVAEVRAEGAKRLAAGNFDKAKKAFEERGRDSFIDIQPKQSDDTRALVGWNKLPKPATDVPATTASLEHAIPPKGTALTSGTVPVPGPSASGAPHAAGSATPAQSASGRPATSAAPAHPSTSAAPAHGGAH